jgi:monoamine oxidase
MTLTRRAVLAGAVSLAAVRRAPAAGDTGVVVVGAGAAGLAAARQLRRGALSFVVLEARSRIGGRAFTDTSLGVPFDAGAQYIHWAERNPWTGIAAELGVPLLDDGSSGPPMVFQRGVRLDAPTLARRREAFRRVWSLLVAGDADRSFADAAREAGEDILSAAAAITRLSLGEEPDRVSLADYDQLWAGDDYAVPDGYGALVARWGADIPVRLDTPVRRIRWDGPGVEVDTAGGTLRAAAAIVTASIGVLGGGLRFVPELPPGTQAALDGLRMGAYTKIALKIDRARLRPPEASDYFEIGEAGTMTSYELWPFGRHLALAYLGGDHARQICAAGERAAIAYARERLAALAGADVAAAVTGGRLAGWWTDPFALGSYSIARPGRADARAALRVPIGERVWLAGEASAGGGAMTVGGATLDGERAAGEVIRSLRGGQAR